VLQAVRIYMVERLIELIDSFHSHLHR
jgi:hypothetical protein